MIKSDKYRLRIYETFARGAWANGLKWVVAHGAEGCPQTIGRDLDILCDGVENINLAVELFKEAARKQPDTKWIVEPHPIWGRRVLAISENYEVAELHILYKLNSGLLDCRVDWDKVNDDLFPHSEEVTFFKSKLMPLLGGSAKIERYTDKDVSSFSWSVRRVFMKNNRKKNVTPIDKFLVYLQTGGINIFRMYKNYKYAKNQKSAIPAAATTPIILIKPEQLPEIANELNEIFLEFVCGDELSSDRINYHQTRQRLVYLTKSRKDLLPELDLSEDDILNLEAIVDSFCSFNASRKKEYLEYFEQRVVKGN